MKLFHTLLLLLYSSSIFAQNAAETEYPKAFRDSVFKKYMREGAWSQPLFSRARERYIDSALAIMPHDAYLWQQRAMPLEKQNKYELSAPYLDSAAKYDPKRYVEYRALIKCIFEKNYRAAIADFDLARSINGNSGVMDHPYDFYTGLCYLQLNKFDSAETYINKCIEAKKKSLGENWVHYVHWFYMGVTRYEQEDYAGALGYFEKSLKDYPHFSDAEYYKAECLAVTGRKAEALEVIRKAKADADKGYTLNEDSAFYETYPYQVKKFFMKGTLEWIEEINKEKDDKKD